ncbi:hypothetical protein NE237_001003 [Protea cynaroides]|uniref:Uncharacterized protein n=1 Tax=Protea cynaroides TaxID=273540 RepID=A0A9Q0QY02_9MAGN|nr:hypothetical protein NE237_001003 [Protea cynaroides]
MENMVLTNCCNIACRTKTAIPSGFTFTSSCGDAQKLHSGFQQSSEINIVDGRKSSSDVSLHVNNAEHCLTLFVDGKEKGAEVEHLGTKDIDWLMVSQKENMNLASCKSTYSPKKDDTCLERVLVGYPCCYITPSFVQAWHKRAHFQGINVNQDLQPWL